jgi:hypothetical protein
MKSLFLLSAFLLALSACNKEMPVPDPDPTFFPYYDPGDDYPPDYDPGDDTPPSYDPGDDTPPSYDPGDDDGSGDGSGDDGSDYSSRVRHKAAPTVKHSVGVR